MISLPESLLAEVDDLATIVQLNRSEFIREAMRMYINEHRRLEIREQMKKGYQEMAKINLSLAAEHCSLEDEVQEIYEEKLAECR